MSPKVERRGVEPRLPGCKPSVFPLDQRPIVLSPEVRPGIEPDPRPYHRRVQPKHLQTITQLQSDPGWSRTIAFLVVIQASLPPGHGIVVTRVGVEPTKSPGSRPGRFASLRTQSVKVAGSGVAPDGQGL